MLEERGKKKLNMGVLLYRLSCPRGCFSRCMMITCLNSDENSSEMCEGFCTRKRGRI